MDVGIVLTVCMSLDLSNKSLNCGANCFVIEESTNFLTAFLSLRILRKNTTELPLKVVG